MEVLLGKPTYYRPQLGQFNWGGLLNTVITSGAAAYSAQQQADAIEDAAEAQVAVAQAAAAAQIAAAEAIAQQAMAQAQAAAIEAAAAAAAIEQAKVIPGVSNTLLAVGGAGVLGIVGLFVFKVI